jgi:hypothetical protein
MIFLVCMEFPSGWTCGDLFQTGCKFNAMARGGAIWGRAGKEAAP